MKPLFSFTSLTYLLPLSWANPQTIAADVGFNIVMNARNLYIFPKIGWLASNGTNGQGVRSNLHRVHKRKRLLTETTGLCLFRTSVPGSLQLDASAG
jgi:hypothetical protein